MSTQNLQELKRRVGFTPFSERIHLSTDGYSPCPFHKGDGQKSFHVMQQDDGACIGTCFSTCGQSFDAIDFVKKFDKVQTGEAIQRLTAISENGSASNGSSQKPKAIPMTADVWAKSGRKVTEADVAKLSASRPHSMTPSTATLNQMGFKIGEKHKQNFLVAPYRLGGTFHTLKARNLEKKEFFQENSVSQQGLFNIDAVTEGCDVYVVESELDAAVLYESGYIAVSVVNAKQKAVEPDVLKKLLTAHRIFLVGDSDEAGRTCMDNLARLLPTEKIYRMIIPDVKDVGELALAFKENEIILGDFRQQWNELRKEALTSWVTQNIPFASAIEAKPMEWTVDKMLPYGGLLLFSGKYGAYKSLWALFLAAGIESGTSVFGRKVLREIPVLYVDRENHQQTVGERRTGIHLPENAVRYWGDWLEGQETPNLDDPRLAEFAIREKGVIIFDSLTDWLAGANENDPSAMTDIMRKFRRLARFGAGVILLHHADKYRSGYRGTTAIPAGADMAMKAQKTEDGILQIREEKFRMCGSWEMDVAFQFDEQYTYRVLRDESPDARKKTESITERNLVHDVLAIFHESHQGAGMTQTQLSNAIQAHGVPRAKAREMIAAGARAKQWTVDSGARNAAVYRLTGWKPEQAAF